MLLDVIPIREGKRWSKIAENGVTYFKHTHITARRKMEGQPEYLEGQVDQI